MLRAGALVDVTRTDTLVFAASQSYAASHWRHCHCGDLLPVRRLFGGGGRVYARVAGFGITDAKSGRAGRAGELQAFRALRGYPRGAWLDFDRTRFAPFPQLGSVGDDVGGSVGSHFVLRATVLLISLGSISVGRIADNGTSSCRLLFLAFLNSTPIFPVAKICLNRRRWVSQHLLALEPPACLLS
jgi:hypothetical protein